MATTVSLVLTISKNGITNSRDRCKDELLMSQDQILTPNNNLIRKLFHLGDVSES